MCKTVWLHFLVQVTIDEFSFVISPRNDPSFISGGEKKMKTNEFQRKLHFRLRSFSPVAYFLSTDYITHDIPINT